MSGLPTLNYTKNLKLMERISKRVLEIRSTGNRVKTLLLKLSRRRTKRKVDKKRPRKSRKSLSLIFSKTLRLTAKKMKRSRMIILKKLRI
jgi:transglutaminase/protease-like cytokinesis protein 3